jgi:hypothetical protein
VGVVVSVGVADGVKVCVGVGLGTVAVGVKVAVKVGVLVEKIEAKRLPDPVATLRISKTPTSTSTPANQPMM